MLSWLRGGTMRRMRFDSTFAGAPADVAAAVAAAQDAGYDGLTIAELRHDPFVVATLACAVPARLRIGTGVAIAFARSPMTVAQSAWDLHRLSDGRFELGLGSQIEPHITKRFSMPWGQPAARMREYIAAVRAIWAAWQDGTRLTFRGEFYTHTLMTPMFNPGPLTVPPPRIQLAAVGPLMIAVAAQAADGLIVHPFTTHGYLTEVITPLVERHLAGRDRGAFELNGQVMVATGANEREERSAVEEVKAQLAFYGSTPAYRPVWEHHGLGALGDELNRLSKRGLWHEMAGLIDDATFDHFAVRGTPEEAGAELARRYAGRFDRLAPTLMGPHGPALAARVIAGARNAPHPGCVTPTGPRPPE